MKQSHRIEVDTEVFEFLQEHSTPLIDTPNDVLRRLLLRSDSKGRRAAVDTSPTRSRRRPPGDVQSLVREILQQEFGGEFRRRGRYRLMFESPEHLVYVQNFNKPADHLWYRVTERPWLELQQSDKDASLCFTNPADRFAYVLPVRDVVTRVGDAGWNREDLEVNIDAVSSRWIELDWKIDRYLRQY